MASDGALGELVRLLAHPVEGPLLRPLVTGQGDAAEARRAFKRHLEATGDARAALFVEHERVMAATTVAEHRAALEAYEAAASGVSWVLRRLLLPEAPIGLCGQRSLPVLTSVMQCPMAYERLQPTDEPGARYCGVCRQRVYLCSEMHEAVRRAREGSCVSMPGEVAAGLVAELERRGAYTGRVELSTVIEAALSGR